MPYRTLEINNPAEIHVSRGQLEISNENGLFRIPLDDLTTIVCSGSNIRHYSQDILPENVDSREANAAREYFLYLHPGLNRRSDDPVNSCLNYGYAVLRNAIIRSVILSGFQPSFGLHHDNYLNAFNLADDLIEPWRPFVDLIALESPGTSSILSRTKRKELAMVLHHACLVHGKRMSVQSGIEEMVSSIRNRITTSLQDPLKLPVLIPKDVVDAVKE